MLFSRAGELALEHFVERRAQGHVELGHRQDVPKLRQRGDAEFLVLNAARHDPREMAEVGIDVDCDAMDQEAVAYLFRQYALVSAPVVDEADRLIGVVTVDDVVRVIDEEAEEDLMKIVGASDTDFHAPPHIIAWQRVRWLVVTLINTMIAATVISQFQDTIQHTVALAVLMPIVAAMGGNAGVQVITVTVRALATRDITPQSNMVASIFRAAPTCRRSKASRSIPR